jgi:acetyl/propionyl-CoA carboxylase alpha subunit
MTRRIRTVLIANRGEIAWRILRTVQANGRRGVVVFHELDADSAAVRAADAAVRITGATPVGAYLDAAQIIAAAHDSGADAIHPGYGFLAENAAFARAVADAGMIFIGPSPESIELMGDKVRARAFVAARGFPVAPSAIEDEDPRTFPTRARELGPPLLIKPAAGGGGKGMRIVRDMPTLDAELERGRSEGQRYFGDGRLYVERYVERPRHIEVQVLGDHNGQVVHLWERECSVQRRFQKVIEETPSPALTPEERQAICEVAAGIARAAGYVNAGTVEFIYGDGAFYFLEMNTRLQVEHPVTEFVTGLDLVAEQLRIAEGEALGYTQADVRQQGHAIELRLYAEDPARNHAPTTGCVLRLRWPERDGVRIDSGIVEGARISAAFDPMLAKIVAHGIDRTRAIARARAALHDTVLLGLTTNREFLERVLADKAFASGAIHTGFLEERAAELAVPPPDSQTLAALIAAAALADPALRAEADAVPALHAAIGPWRN